MKKLIQLSVFLKWARLWLIVIGGQAGIQVLTFFSGILIVRVLTTREYALFTLASAMFATMSILADSGVSGCVMSEGGRVWQDSRKLGMVMATASRVRRQLALWIVGAVAPLAIYLLYSHGANICLSILITVLVVALFWNSLVAFASTIPLQLAQKVGDLQLISIKQNAIRLILLAALLYYAPYAAVILVVTVISQVWATVVIQRKAAGLCDPKAGEDAEMRRRMFLIVRRSLPGNIYYALQGQIAIFLISILGNSDGIAKVGALGRLSQILVLFSSVFGLVVVPRFARLNADVRRLRVYFGGILAATVAVVGSLTVAAWLFPSIFLFILGENYMGLNYELVLMIASAGFGQVVGVAYSLSIARGFVFNQLYSVLVFILLQAVLIALLNGGTVAGVLWMNLIISGVQALFFSGWFFYALSRLENGREKIL